MRSVGLRNVERPRGDEEDVVGAHGAVLRGDRGALHDGQDVALHALARDVGAVAAFPARDLVDLVEEDDPRGLRALHRQARHLILVHEAGLFFLPQDLARFRNGEGAAARASAEQAGEHVLQVHVHLLDSLAGEDLERGEAPLRHLDLHRAGLEGARAELLPELLPGGAKRIPGRVGGFRALGNGGWPWGREQEVEHPLLGLGGRALPHLGELLAAHHVDGRLHEVADDRVHVPADVADLGELAEASTFTKGLAESWARRRAISVLPTPVGPIIRMFLGVISAATSGGRRWRRIRFRSAMATARLAAPWPTT